MNLLFLALVLVLLFMLLPGSSVKVPKGAALVLDLQGTLTDQPAAGSFDPLSLISATLSETVLRQVVEVLETAATDASIEQLVLDLDSFAGADLAKLAELSTALETFRKSGKKISAFGSTLTQSDYFLASHADDVVLDPLGEVQVVGFASYRSYYKQALDTLEVDYNIFRVGEYKSAMEPYLRSDMSDEDRQARNEWLQALWLGYTTRVAEARGISRERLDRFAHEYPSLLEAVAGDTATAALEFGLVDRLLDRHAFESELAESLGAAPGEANGRSRLYRSIGLEDYAQARLPETGLGTGNTVGLIVARGTILPGDQPAGLIGSESLVPLIEQAIQDGGIKALVLRVDSPGGSLVASERIRRALERFADTDKPLLVSMSGVAASGGYWIALPAREIWAQPGTLTGSIGIFGAVPTFERSLSRLGVTSDGVETGPLAAGFRPDRSLPAELRDSIQRSTERGYEQFLERVAAARGMSRDEVDVLARGRVWSAGKALELGLIDQLGDLQSVTARARELAGLADNAPLRQLEREPSFRESLIEGLSELTTRLGLGPLHTEAVGKENQLGPLARPIELLLSEARSLLWLEDPRGLYAHCLCEGAGTRP